MKRAEQVIFLKLTAPVLLSINRRMTRELNAGSVVNTTHIILQFCWLG